jgi:AraC-like DNA-binding protein
LSGQTEGLGPSDSARSAHRLALDERTGLLAPEQATRFGARWFQPDPAIADVVDRFWSTSWQFPSGESYRQRIIATPLINLTIESGDVPGRFVITGVYRNVWDRRLTGVGAAFGIRLAPAGLAVLSDLAPQDVADRTVVLTPESDHRLHAFLTALSEGLDVIDPSTFEEFVRRSTTALAGALRERPVTSEGLLANHAVAELAADRRIRSGDQPTGPQLADALGTSERSIQRALKATVGHGPKWISRRARLQAVALALSVLPRVSIAQVAAELGYADQSHLINDFRLVVGATPGDYVRSLRPLHTD